MAVQGRSVAKGGRPIWLSVASDIRFVGISGKNETMLHFEAPSMGEAVPKLYEQKEFWSEPPARNSTGFEILSAVLSDIIRIQRDSDRYDKPLLNRVAGLGKVLNGEFQELVINGKSAKESVKIDRTTIEITRQLEVEVPESREVMVVGRLDMIRHSTRGFEVKLDDGSNARGILLEGEMERLASLFNKEVLVQGLAIYRPSGRLLRIDAKEVSEGEGISRSYSRIPFPLARPSESAALRVRQSPGTGVGAFYGIWPGDETDKELLEALERTG